MIDWAFILNTLVSNEPMDLIESGFFINFLQMVVYNLTDFHLTIYLVMKFLNWAVQNRFFKAINNCIKII